MPSLSSPQPDFAPGGVRGPSDSACPVVPFTPSCDPSFYQHVFSPESVVSEIKKAAQGVPAFLLQVASQLRKEAKVLHPFSGECANLTGETKLSSADKRTEAATATPSTPAREKAPLTTMELASLGCKPPAPTGELALHQVKSSVHSGIWKNLSKEPGRGMDVVQWASRRYGTFRIPSPPSPDRAEEEAYNHVGNPELQMAIKAAQSY